MIHNVIGLRTLYDRRQFITVQLEKKIFPVQIRFSFFFLCMSFLFTRKNLFELDRIDVDKHTNAGGTKTILAYPNENTIK